MYTPEEACEIIKNYLNVDALTSIIKGSVCDSGCRPDESDEDVTIGCINLTDPSGENDTQRGTFNVNFYKKDVPAEYQNKVLNQPDIPRFAVVVKKIIDILQGEFNQGLYWSYGNLWVSGVSGTLKLPETKEHFKNIRVEVKLHQPNAN